MTTKEGTKKRSEERNRRKKTDKRKKTKHLKTILKILINH